MLFLKTLLPIFCFTLFGISIYGQMEATTSTGDGILLSSDGTWEYKIEDINQSVIETAPESKNSIVAVSDNQNTATNLPIAKVDVAPSYILFKNKKSCPFRIEKEGSSTLIHFDILKVNQNSKNDFRDLGCVNAMSYAHLKFKDGSTLRLNSTVDTNCTDGIRADITEHVAELIDKKIELIRFSFADNYTDVKLHESSQIEIPMKLATL